MRADLVTARTAIALAAWHGRDVVTEEDIRVAARLALPHRRRRDPFDAPGLDEQALDEALREATTPSPIPAPSRPAPAGPDDTARDGGGPDGGRTAADDGPDGGRSPDAAPAGPAAPRSGGPGRTSTADQTPQTTPAADAAAEPLRPRRGPVPRPVPRRRPRLARARQAVGAAARGPLGRAVGARLPAATGRCARTSPAPSAPLHLGPATIARGCRRTSRPRRAPARPAD